MEKNKTLDAKGPGLLIICEFLELDDICANLVAVSKDVCAILKQDNAQAVLCRSIKKYFQDDVAVYFEKTVKGRLKSNGENNGFFAELNDAMNDWDSFRNAFGLGRGGFNDNYIDMRLIFQKFYDYTIIKVFLAKVCMTFFFCVLYTRLHDNCELSLPLPTKYTAS